MDDEVRLMNILEHEVRLWYVAVKSIKELDNGLWAVVSATGATLTQNVREQW